MLAAGGAVGGTLLATSIVHGLVTLKPVGMPRLDAVHVDLPVLIFAAALGLATTAVVGVLPAWQSADVAAALKTGGTTTTGSRHARQARRVLGVLELAVSVVLIVGASQFARSQSGASAAHGPRRRHRSRDLRAHRSVVSAGNCR